MYDATAIKTEDINPGSLNKAIETASNNIIAFHGIHCGMQNRFIYHLSALLDAEQALYNPTSCEQSTGPMDTFEEDAAKCAEEEKESSHVGEVEVKKPRKAWSEESRNAAAERMRARQAEKRNAGGGPIA